MTDKFEKITTKIGTYKTNGEINEDYYTFGKEIIALGNGKIVLVVDDIKDNKPGDLNPIYILANSVILKTASNEFLFCLP